MRKVHEKLRDEYQVIFNARALNFTYWKGMSIVKPAEDIIRYHEIIWKTKPDIIIECGTCWGSSASFFQDNLDMIGNDGFVVSIDKYNHKFKDEWRNSSVKYLLGSSIDPEIFEQVECLIKDKSALYTEPLDIMVSLDSNHHKRHVLKELDLYSKLIIPGQYMVVDDTAINGRPILGNFGPGPGEALDEWLPKHPEFKNDMEIEERYMCSYNYGGWLKRIK